MVRADSRIIRLAQTDKHRDKVHFKLQHGEAGETVPSTVCRWAPSFRVDFREGRTTELVAKVPVQQAASPERWEDAAHAADGGRDVRGRNHLQPLVHGVSGLVVQVHPVQMQGCSHRLHGHRGQQLCTGDGVLL